MVIVKALGSGGNPALMIRYAIRSQPCSRANRVHPLNRNITSTYLNLSIQCPLYSVNASYSGFHPQSPISSCSSAYRDTIFSSRALLSHSHSYWQCTMFQVFDMCSCNIALLNPLKTWYLYVC